MNIESIISDNRAVLVRMRDLNLRAGRDAFPLPSREDLNTRFATALAGARRAAEVVNFDLLRLPALDELAVQGILADCPDTIMVLGQQVQVEYDDEFGDVRSDPCVKLHISLTDGRVWLKLTDEGVVLPNGRRVAVALNPQVGEWVADTDIPALKRKVLVSLNKRQWGYWRQPELPKPTDVLPPIVEQVYGRCTITDLPLVAFGTLRRSWGSWVTYWSNDRAETERVHVETCRQFDEQREQSKRDALKKRLSELYNSLHHTAPDVLPTRIYHAIYGHSPQSTAEMEVLIVEAEALVKPNPAPQAPALDRVDLSKLFGGAKVR
jgi:hypothetical protein